MRQVKSNSWFKSIGLAMLCGVVSAWSALPIGTVSSQWKPVMIKSIFDPDNDFTNSATDLVGDATHPHMYLAYDTAVSAANEADDTIAFRFRIDKSPDFDPDKLKNGNMALGIDLNRDNALDVYLRMYGNSQGDLTIGVAESSPPSTNVSPSTSGFGNETNLNSAKYSYKLQRTKLLGETWDTFPADSDWFFDVKVVWSELKSIIDTKHLLNGTSLGALISASTGSGGLGGVNRNSIMRFIVFSSVNGNNINGDVAGYNDKVDDLTVRFADKGAFSDDQSFSNLPPTITAPTSSSSYALNYTSGGTAAILDANATDPEATALTYSISGTDASLFAINSSTGVLTWNATPNIASPLDAGANNVYDLFVKVTDAQSGVDSLAVAITVVAGGSNTAPSITGGNTQSANVNENQTSAFDVDATDVDAGAVISYALAGTDAGLFDINSSTGVITFKVAPDYENPTDAGANRIYDLLVRVRDGQGDSTTLTLTLNLQNINEFSPAISSNGAGATASISVAENTTAVTTVLASDADSSTSLVYSIASGEDAAKFQINSSTGVLTFVNAPDYENPTDGNTSARNTYIVVVRASDGVNTDDQTITVTVTNINEFSPAISSNGAGATASISVAENTTAVTTVLASDADSSTSLVYSIASGEDAAKFQINSSTGVLTFVNAPDYENPTDGNTSARNTYIVVVRASDGVNSDDQTITVTVTNVNESSPVISSNGAGATAAISVAENTTAVTTVLASDADSSTSLVYSIPSGEDAAKFQINSSTGVLTFVNAPDFENPTDGNTSARNTYIVVVRASDGVNTDDQTITVTVTNVNEFSPGISSNGAGATAAISVAENTTAVTTVLAGDADSLTSLVYSIPSGEDAAKFQINSSTGVLTFVNAPDFENPTDGITSARNTYIVVVRASDGVNSDDQTITVTVTNVDESVNQSPAITGGNTQSANVNENQTSAFDVGANRIYDLVVTVNDGQGGTTVLTLTLNLLNVDESPIITSNLGGATAAITIDENTTAITTVQASDVDAATTIVYSLNGGGNASKFIINSNTGALSLNIVPDYENPLDGPLSGYNTYLVNVRASDGVNYDEQLITVTVVNVNESPTNITLSHLSIAENAGVNVEIGVLGGIDPDSNTTLVYSLPTGVLDNNLFDIIGGKLVAKSSFDYEAKSSYTVRVRVSDGVLTYEKEFTITVTDVFENQVAQITGGNSQSANVNENQTSAFDVDAVDGDGGTITYSLGGIDAGLFDIHSSTGVITFKVAPDYETPSDAGVNRIYDLVVTVNDGQGGSSVLTLTLNLQNVNESPTNITLSHLSIAENAGVNAEIGVLGGTDPDANTTLIYTLPEGVLDNNLFDIIGGKLVAKASFDFETKSSYTVRVRVTDGALSYEKEFVITVTNVFENQVAQITGGNSQSANVNENQTSAFDVDAVDADGGTITYSLGGSDADLFDLNSSTGVITFKVAPDFENPSDAGANRIYDLVVTVTDGQGGSSVLTLTLNLQNVNESPTNITLSHLSIAENAGVNAEIGVLGGTDPDANTTLIYTLPEGVLDNNLFDIIGGKLVAKASFDFETKSSYTVRVRVSDGVLTYEKEFTIQVVNQAEKQSLAWMPFTAKVYGDPEFKIQANSSSQQTIQYASVNPNIASVSGDVITIKAAGQVKILAVLAANENDVADTVAQDLVIQKAELLANSQDTSRVYGTANPKFVLRLSGFKYQDQIGDLALLPEMTTSATTNSPVGKYPILMQSVVLANYVLQYKDTAWMTIKASVEVVKIQDSVQVAEKLSNLKIHGDTLISLPSLSPLNLPYIYEVLTPSKANVVNNQLSVLDTGWIQVRMISPGDQNHIGDTVVSQFYVAWTNHAPTLETQAIHKQTVIAAGALIGNLLTKDVDADRVSLQLLNRTADFKMVGNELYAKQILDGSESVIKLYFLVSDGYESSRDTLVLHIDPVNTPPEILSSSVQIRSGTEAQFLTQIPVSDADGDPVSIRLLNYTADFKMINDSLFNKQILDGSANVFNLKLELNDGKSLVIVPYKVYVLDEVSALRNTLFQSKWIRGEQFVADANQVLTIMNLTGQIISTHSLLKGESYSLSSLTSGSYLINWGVETITWRKVTP